VASAIKKPFCSFFNQWPYDEALRWMVNAYSWVVDHPNDVLIGCGSHKETVITLGRKSLDPIIKPQCGVIFRKVERGGGITAHEPGQLVLYPVLDLLQQKKNPPQLVFALEEAMINLLQEVGIAAHRSKLGPGIFVQNEKLGFIGLRIKNHITQHGLALNIFNDGKIFSTFDPCGVPSLKVSSAYLHTKLSHSLSYYMERLTNHVLESLNLPSS
jgi:lipoate-protein ligase B